MRLAAETMQSDSQALQQVREDRFLINQADSWLYQEMLPFIGERVLEVGCGLGNLTRHLAGRHLVVGIDISPSSVEYVRRRYAGYPSVDAIVSDISSPSSLELACFEFDTAISINVFEHIEDDELALEHTWELLSPGGVLLLVVPAHQLLYGTMDQAIGHFRRYDRRELADKLHNAGFEIRVQKHLNALGAVGWFFSGRILRSQTPPKGQLKLMNLIIPFVRRIERLLPPPFGVSLFTAARRPT